MVENMFDLRALSGHEATWGTDPFGRVHQVRWRPSDWLDGRAGRLNDSAALRLAGERTVPVTHRNRGSRHGADDPSEPSQTPSGVRSFTDSAVLPAVAAA